jgi:hypothetical protein
MTTRVLLLAGCLLAVGAPAAYAQQSMADVLGFLLTNRSIATDDFDRDTRAADQMRMAISDLLTSEAGRLPITSGAGGFTYRMNPSLGVMERSSASFGPFYVERALTAGARQALLSVLVYDVGLQKVDGRSLRDGSLVATASRLRGETEPFDVETLTLRLRTSIVAVLGTYGVTDRFDVGVVVPFVRLTMAGERVDTYRGQQSVQATATAATSGFGDLIVRGKYHLLRDDVFGLAAGAEARLPTGRTEDLLGVGSASIQPRVVASAEGARFGGHALIGPSFGGASREWNYAAGLTVVGSSRITIAGELIGRRISSVGRLADVVEPHPNLEGIETIRLTSTSDATNRLMAVFGVKWNVAGPWLMTAHAQRALTSAGLTGGWAPSVSLDYSFGR